MHLYWVLKNQENVWKDLSYAQNTIYNSKTAAYEDVNCMLFMHIFKSSIFDALTTWLFYVGNCILCKVNRLNVYAIQSMLNLCYLQNHYFSDQIFMLYILKFCNVYAGDFDSP